MLDNASKAFFHLLARSRLLQQLASRYGMRRPSSFARRFIAGETVDEAIAAARTVEAQGLTQTLDYLGESIGTLADADAATREYLAIIDAIVAAGIGRNLSLKLTQIGLAVDRASTVDNLRRILDHANGFFVRIDMENSPYTAVTLNIFETLWNQGYRHMGVVLQAELRRSEDDIDRINQLVHGSGSSKVPIVNRRPWRIRRSLKWIRRSRGCCVGCSSKAITRPSRHTIRPC